MQKKVFIIEDEANTLYSLQAKFRVKGFEVLTEPGNSKEEEIIKKIAKFNPDFIVLDLLLPESDGFKILSLAKKEEKTKSIPVFVFTNMGDLESREKGKKLGANYYFLKDKLNMDEFIEKTGKIMENSEKVMAG